MYMLVKKDGCVSDSWEYDCEGYLKRKKTIHHHINSSGCCRGVGVHVPCTSPRAKTGSMAY